MTPEFQAYAKQVLANAVALGKGCVDSSVRLVTGDTDTHMVMLDVSELMESRLAGEQLLSKSGLITNKNMIPFDKLPPSVSSGIRIGSSLMTTRGAKEDTMYRIGQLIGEALNNPASDEILEGIKKEVFKIATSFQIFSPEWIPAICRDEFIKMS